MTLSRSTLELVVYDLGSIASRVDETLQFTPDIQASYSKIMTAFVEQLGTRYSLATENRRKDF